MPSALARFIPASLDDWQKRLSFLLLAGSVSLALISIAASQILLAAAIAAGLLLMRPKVWRMPLPLLLPLALLFLWTIAIVFIDAGSLKDDIVRKFFLYTLLFLVPAIACAHDRITWIYHAIFASAGLSALAGLFQYGIDPNRTLLDRIKGFMSIWMTYSGLLMLVLVALVAYAVWAGLKKHIWIIPLGLMLIAALHLSQTRSTELGACAGIAVVLLLLRRPRWIVGLVLFVAALYLVSPASFQQRLRNAVNLQDANTRNRIEISGTALRLISAHPWTGVGQRVSTEALKYRGTRDFPDYMYLHMHNNALQFAAERGVPGLLLWVWFSIALLWQAFKTLRTSHGAKSAAFVAAAAVGGWVAMQVAGMFEYNFGDSEVLTLFLFMMSAPLSNAVLSAES